jgi:hypothetical protein
MLPGGCGSQIVALMTAGFAPRASRTTKKTALRGFMFAPAVFALYGWSVAAQSTTTYAYTGAPFSLSDCQAEWLGFGNPFVTCLATGNLTATVTFADLPSGFSGAYCYSVGGITCQSTIASWSISGAGATLNSTDNICYYRNGDFTSVDVVFENGSIVNWYFDVYPCGVASVSMRSIFFGGHRL